MDHTAFKFQRQILEARSPQSESNAHLLVAQAYNKFSQCMWAIVSQDVLSMNKGNRSKEDISCVGSLYISS